MAVPHGVTQTLYYLMIGLVGSMGVVVAAGRRSEAFHFTASEDGLYCYDK
jgi:hypothetical protein